MKWIKVKSLLLKRLFPRLAINKYCLRENLDAYLYLPSVRAQLDAVFSRPKNMRVGFVRERVWSVEVRSELYCYGLWEGLVPENLWELGYLLEHTVPVGYAANLVYNRRKLSSFTLIIEALNKNLGFVEFAVTNYVHVLEDIGPELLMENLSKEAFDVILKTIVDKHKERALPFMLVASGNKDLYSKLFVSIWKEDPMYQANVKEILAKL